MKKTVLLLMALVMSAGFVFAQSTIPASNNVKGVHVSAKLDPTDDNQWTGANIILGSDAAVWPWSTGGDDGVAFTPVQGATYHLTFNVTSSGTEGFRVRWLSDDTNGGYTAGDGAVVTSQSPWKDPFTADQTPTIVPCYFMGTIESGQTKTYSVDFTMDGNEAAGGLVGNLAIRGQYGTHDFAINTIVITDSNGNMLVNYDKTALPKSNDAPGVHVSVKTDPTDDSQWTGANIILGSDAAVWPFSTAGEDSLIAFTPVKNATYHMEFNVTSSGTEGFRVRWLSDDTNGGYTAGDGAVVTSQSPWKDPFTADQTPTIVPCYFMGTIESGQTKTYSVDFTMDGNEDAGGLVGNLAIRGQYGTHDFVINTIVITDAKGKVLVNYDKSGSEETCKIISDFSQLDRADNGNQLTQQGWLVSGIMDDIAAAKYLVIETEGIGDNADGFGGLHLVFQGNDGDPANITIDWTDRALNGNFVNFPRAEGKKVSIAIDLQNVIGDQYDDFLQCTNWARFILAYYGGASAFEGLALTNAYLTKDFDKPEGAVDLSGGTDWGFVFGGYVDCEGTHTSIKTVKSATVSSVYNTDGGIIVNAVNEKVSIYGIDGRLVNQVTANNNFIALSQGLYIVKVGAAKPVKIFVK